MARLFVVFVCLISVLHAQPDYSISDAMNMIHAMNNTINSRIEKIIQASRPVAFTACLTPADHLGDHQTVEYDRIVTNVGGGYDTRHSHFTASTPGLYQFSVTVMAAGNTEVRVRIVKNGAELVHAYSGTARYESGSIQVFTHLQQGDMVWVQNIQANNPQLQSNLWNCFSGALVQPDL